MSRFSRNRYSLLRISRKTGKVLGEIRKYHFGYLKLAQEEARRANWVGTVTRDKGRYIVWDNLKQAQCTYKSSSSITNVYE